MGVAISLMVGCAWSVATPGLAQSPQPTPGASPAEETSWPALQGGAAHLGAASISGPLPPLRVAWRGRPPGDARMSSAVLVPGLAVVTGATRLLGFHPETGALLWSDVKRAAGPLAPPAIDPESSSLVFTEGNGPRDSGVVAVDMKGRTQRWRFALQDLSRGGPTLAEGGVFVGSRDRWLYSLDAQRGTLRWKKRLDGSANGAPAVSGGAVYAVSENGVNGHVRLYALAVATGKSLWESSPRGVAIGMSSPTVADGKVFVGFGDAQVRAFDARTGKQLWATPVRNSFSFRASLAYSSGDVFALDAGGGVYRLDAGSGDVRWDFQFPSFASWSAPLVEGQFVYVGMDDGTIAGIDAASGHLVWKTRLATRPVGAFVPSGDRLLTSTISAQGALVAFEHRGGALLDEPSPTVLDLPVALLNYAGSFLLVLALLVVLFRVVVKPRRVAGPAATPAED
jgi:outer membrane protein assembly factor BamB